MATQRKHGISWTDETWNPIRGCTRVSEGCKFCYAERVAYRFSAPGQPYEGLAVLKNGHASWTGKIEFVEKHLLDPLSWKKPKRVFVNSMSDLFHENVTDEMRDRIFAVMALCPQHTFQVLTKRPERMLAYLTGAPWGQIEERAVEIAMNWSRISRDNASFRVRLNLNWLPLSNVWLGVSVENQAAADERIPLLLKTPAAVRFLSCEPLLGPVALAASGLFLNWVICGGESGPGARPMHPDWARSLRDQCQAAGVPYFFKQWGAWEVAVGGGIIQPGELWISPSGSTAYPSAHALNGPGDVYAMRRVGKHAAGALLDGVEWKQFPAVQA